MIIIIIIIKIIIRIIIIIIIIRIIIPNAQIGPIRNGHLIGVESNWS